jgi:hypothetical protein
MLESRERRDPQPRLVEPLLPLVEFRGLAGLRMTWRGTGGLGQR